MPVRYPPTTLLALFLGLVAASSASAQSGYSTGFKWGRTELDSIVSVRTPVRGESEQDPELPWAVAFRTSSYYNRFFMMRLDYAASPQFAAQLRDGTQTMVIDVDKFFRRVVKTEFLHFVKPRLTGQHPVSLPAAPDGSALHRTYAGRDDLSQSPATLEATWFVRANVLYVFMCTTTDVETLRAGEEKRQFFGTITIREPNGE